MREPDLSPETIKSQLERGLEYIQNPGPGQRDEIYNACSASLHFMRNSKEPPMALYTALAAVVSYFQAQQPIDAEFRAELIEHIQAGIDACST